MSSLPPSTFFPQDQPTQSSYGLNGRILLTAVLSLVFVVALVVTLHLYARYVLRRRRLAAFAGGRLSPADAIFRIGAASRSQLPPAGLSPSAVAAIPTFAFKAASADESCPSAECAVCLSAVEEGEVVRQLPGCKHVFHVGCIDMWLASHSTCPVCRADASAPPELGGGAVAVESGVAAEAKEESSASRLGSSFRRMLSREWSGRRVQDDGVEDLERQ